MKAAPIRVTRAERDSFVADFKGRLRYLVWGLLPATFLLIALLVLLAPAPNSAAGEGFTWVGIGVLLAIFLPVYFWAWSAPARALVRRPVLGMERSRAEVRKALLERTSYGQLALILFIAIFVGARAFDGNGLMPGWSVLWLVLAGILLVGAAIQAFRKLSSERG